MWVQRDGFNFAACTARGDRMTELMESNYEHLTSMLIVLRYSQGDRTIYTLNGHST
jgi:hypothetical protein